MANWHRESAGGWQGISKAKPAYQKPSSLPFVCACSMPGPVASGVAARLARQAVKLPIERSWRWLAGCSDLCVYRIFARFLSELKDRPLTQLAFILKDRAPSTLRKHVGGWQKWMRLCCDLTILVSHPDAQQAVPGFPGGFGGRGAGKSRWATVWLEPSRWCMPSSSSPRGTHRLGLQHLGEQLDGPIVSSWVRTERWHRQPMHEALPLSLFVACELEQAAATGPHRDWFLVGCFLLMAWSSWRLSDIQRLDLSSVHNFDAIRGWVWRSKTRPTGFALEAK